VSLEVERMTANDFAELRSWLGTTVTTEQNPGKSVVGFIAQIFTRLIGAEAERSQKKSGVFTIR
jgi:hypothetical protein